MLAHISVGEAVIAVFFALLTAYGIIDLTRYLRRRRKERRDG